MKKQIIQDVNKIYQDYKPFNLGEPENIQGETQQNTLSLMRILGEDMIRDIKKKDLLKMKAREFVTRKNASRGIFK